MMNKDRLPDGVKEQEINILDLIAVIVKRKNLILGLILAAAIGSFAYTSLKPPLYVATARVIPPDKKYVGLISVLSTVMEEIPPALMGEKLAENAQICAGILKSKSVEDAAIKRLDLGRSFKTGSQEEAREILKSMVQIEVGKDNIVSVTAQDKDSKLAEAVVNSFVEELGRKYVQLNLIEVGAESAFLTKILDEIRKDLQESEQSLKSFQAAGKDFKNKPRDFATLRGVAGFNQLLVNRRTAPEAKGNQNEVAGLLESVQEDVVRLQAQLPVYERQYRSNPASSDFDKTSDFTRITKELRTKLEVFELLARQYGTVRLSETKNSASVRLQDVAASTQAIKPKRSLIVILSTLTALIIGVFLAFFREYLEKMPEEERVCWREIKHLAGIK